MRIIQFIDILGSGGKERQLVELLKGLAGTEDIECELVIMSEEVHYTYVQELGIRTHYLTRKSKKDLSIFTQLHRLCREIRPDIIHSWNAMCSIYAVPIVKIQKITFVNGALRDAPPRVSFGQKTWLKCMLTFPFSHAIVANSRAGLDAYRVPQRKAFCIHNGFDLERVANLSDPCEVRARLNIDTEKVVGMVASFSDNKDYSAFIGAAKSILAQRKDVTFVAMGDGKNLESMQENMPTQFRKRFKFLGRQKKVEEIVNIFTVGVLVSNASIHGEGISNSVMEYMALGKPVVVTDCGGNRELVQDGQTGFLLEHGDVASLISRTLQLLDDPELALRFGENGHNRIVEQFNLEKMIGKHVELYKKLLAPNHDLLRKR